MKNTFKLIGATVGMLGISLFCQQARANSFAQGSSIAFDGTYTANGSGAGNLTGATAITGVNAIVDGAPGLAPTGSFTGLGSLPATFYTPISLSASSGTKELWSVVSGGNTFEFFTTGNAAASSSGLGTGSAADALSGTGYAEELNSSSAIILGPTGGTWEINVGASGALFLFSGSSVTAPDGCATVSLLGMAMLAVGAVRRKLAV